MENKGRTALPNPGAEKPALRESGFTLLETLIAMALMMISFTVILGIQSDSLNITGKARTMNIATMLAKQAMTEAEMEIECKAFKEVDEEKSGAFATPYEDYKWTRTVKEIEFPELDMSGGGEEEGREQEGQGGMAEMMTKLIRNHFTKAIREVTVTVSWPRGKGFQSYAVTTYWVDLKHEFSLSE